jgi:hypothetical protein
MYNFVFWFFYRFFEKRKKFRSVFVATSLVGLVILVHISLLYSILNFFSLFRIKSWQGSYGVIKYFLIGIVCIFFLIIYMVYYKRNARKILARYHGGKFSSPENVFKIVLLLVIPLIIVFVLS